MSLFNSLFLSVLVASSALAYSPQLGFNTKPLVETRSLDQIYEAALKEGGTVTVWHGGDEKTQQNSLKTAFEARFPGMTLNVTVDLSKYHDVNIDRQLATKDVYVDSIILQTLHDYPRWKEEGAILNYKPVGFESMLSKSVYIMEGSWHKTDIYEEFRDGDGAYMGLFIIAWSNVFAPAYLNGSTPMEYTDYLKPEFKDRLVLTYPNDDDAVLYQFDLM